METRSRPLRPRHRAEHFSQEEILEFIGIVINMNVWTRLKLAEGATPDSPSRRCRGPGHLPTGHDARRRRHGGLSAPF
ncbi:MAG TPA: hypothetical protein VFH48_16540 [Chloroflexota bacterium]|nr:hypothetical protein [Chloroflexota bacterium]